VGVRYFSAELRRENHPDGYKFTALIPNGPMNPRVPASDPDKATSFFVLREGGIAGMRSIAGPFKIESAPANDGTGAMRNMLNRQDDIRRAVFLSAFPTYSRSTPPALGDIKARRDGTFTVTVQLKQFGTGEVKAEKNVHVDRHGQVIERASPGRSGGVSAGGGDSGVVAGGRGSLGSRDSGSRWSGGGGGSGGGWGGGGSGGRPS
jgi:hypothetical protein